MERHILEETFLTAIYVGKIISLRNENAQKRRNAVISKTLTT